MTSAANPWVKIELDLASNVVDKEVEAAVDNKEIAAPINNHRVQAWRNLDTGALIIAVATDNRGTGEVVISHRIPGTEFRDISPDIAALHHRRFDTGGNDPLPPLGYIFGHITAYIDYILSPAPNYIDWVENQAR